MNQRATVCILKNVRLKVSMTKTVDFFCDFRNLIVCAPSKTLCLENYDENSIKIVGDLTSNNISTGKKRMKKNKKTIEKLIQMKKENENHIRNLNNIHVNGSDVPEPTETFEKLFSTFDIPIQLQKNLLSYGFPEPTAIQMQSLPALLNVN
jgi:hypothetical protein